MFRPTTRRTRYCRNSVHFSEPISSLQQQLALRRSPCNALRRSVAPDAPSAPRWSRRRLLNLWHFDHDSRSRHSQRKNSPSQTSAIGSDDGGAPVNAHVLMRGHFFDVTDRLCSTGVNIVPRTEEGRTSKPAINSHNYTRLRSVIVGLAHATDAGTNSRSDTSYVQLRGSHTVQHKPNSDAFVYETTTLIGL
ncbi:hypothetical protein EI94DRAFT_1741725 [Lactarius quietus]|nr:hypothetical protein EI94DRAFT_1741725 [Lactarius quietus]